MVSDTSPNYLLRVSAPRFKHPYWVRWVPDRLIYEKMTQAIGLNGVYLLMFNNDSTEHKSGVTTVGGAHPSPG